MIHKTINVSFPRSGHHMLVEVLKCYFGDEFHYCEWHSDYYKRPDVCAETNFTKTHDHHLTWPVSPEYHHLVQVRSPLYSIASWRIHHKGQFRYFYEDQEVSKQKVEFWAKWVNKWILSPVPNRLIVQYESLIMRKSNVWRKVVEFVSPDAVNMDKLCHCIDVVNPRPIENTTDDWIGWL